MQSCDEAGHQKAGSAQSALSLAFYFMDKVAAVFRMAPGTELIDKLSGGFSNFGAAFANPLPSFHPIDLLVGVAGAACFKLAVYINSKNRKKFRQGEEYGSARWGKPEDIKPYMDPVFSNNVILTQTEFLTMNSRPKQPKYARNKNILVIGGSGSGKTRFFVKPNLMQLHSSYVVTDPKGTLLVERGKMLEKTVRNQIAEYDQFPQVHALTTPLLTSAAKRTSSNWSIRSSSTRREMAISPVRILGEGRKASITRRSLATSGMRHLNTRKFHHTARNDQCF